MVIGLVAEHSEYRCQRHDLRRVRHVASPEDVFTVKERNDPQNSLGGKVCPLAIVGEVETKDIPPLARDRWRLLVVGIGVEMLEAPLPCSEQHHYLQEVGRRELREHWVCAESLAAFIPVVAQIEVVDCVRGRDTYTATYE